jgi:non-specific riboncleoside hydrolase
MKKMNLWIDTDMGNDDIMALAMLVQDPSIDIKAISLVNGVSRVKKGLPNLKGILEYLNQSPPIFEDISIRNYPYNLEFPKQDINRAEELTLLENLPIKPLETKADDLKNLLSTLPDLSVLLALGPLTNIANLMQSSPDLFKKKVTKIILMGGGIEKGNVLPLRVAEYNIALDPEAANVVFNFNLPITMIGIDATCQVPCTEEYKQEVKKLKPDNPAGSVLQEMILNNEGDFDQFYDPLAAAILMKPELIVDSLSGQIKIVSDDPKKAKTAFISKEGNTTVPLLIDQMQFFGLLNSYMIGFKNVSN